MREEKEREVYLISCSRIMIEEKKEDGRPGKKKKRDRGNWEGGRR